jgi:hypothetical protein
MYNNKKQRNILKLIRLSTERKNPNLYNHVNARKKSTIQEEFQSIFKTEIDQLTVRKTVEHRIITEQGIPIVQKNFQIPQTIEVENRPK